MSVPLMYFDFYSSKTQKADVVGIGIEIDNVLLYFKIQKCQNTFN